MSLLSPKSSPSGLITGVRKVNNLPLFLILGALALVVVVFFIALINRAEKSAQIEAGTQQQQDTTATTPSSAPNSTLLDLTKRYGSSGMVASADTNQQATEVAPAEAPVLPAAAPAAAAPMPPAGSAPLQAVKGEKDAAPKGNPIDVSQTIATFNARKAQDFEQALSAKSSIPIPTYNDSRAADGQLSSAEQSVAKLVEGHGSNGAPASYAERLAAAKKAAGSASGNGGGGGGGSPSAGGEQDGFGTPSTASSWELDDRMENPQTPYVVRTGFVIPGVMISGINSDLPGMLKAQVSQDVFDTATGKYLLVPQGSILVGRYNSEVLYGQERVQVAWQRITFPDGRVLNIGGMPGADGAGYSGLQDQVNNHWGKIFGAAFAMSVITAGYSMSQDNSSSTSDKRDAGTALSESMGQQMGQAGSQIIQKSLAIQPTIEIRPGMRFNIMINKDMVFDEPYQAFNY